MRSVCACLKPADAGCSRHFKYSEATGPTDIKQRSGQSARAPQAGLGTTGAHPLLLRLLNALMLRVTMTWIAKKHRVPIQ